MDAAVNLPDLNVPTLLREAGIQPKKSLGQNFLLDPGALQKIVRGAEVTHQTDVLEVGPGLGSLTRYLAASGRKVTAVELDGRLIPVLERVLEPFSNVNLIHGDILKLDPAALMNQPGFRVVANIPYYITSALIRHLLEASCKPECLILTIQREVAERICAAPGDMNLLALSVQVYGCPKVLFRIPAGSFYPAPKVDSSTLKIDLYGEPLVPTAKLDGFFRLAKAGFGQKRKTLRNALAVGLRIPAGQVESMLAAAQLDPSRRAETLSMEEWNTLTEVFYCRG